MPPLPEEFPNFLAEVFPHNDVENGVENTVEEGKVHEDWRPDVRESVHATRVLQNFNSFKYIHYLNHVEWCPAKQESQEDCQNQKGGLLLRFLDVISILKPVSQSPNYFVSADGNNKHRNNED